MTVRLEISFRECSGHLAAVEVIHVLANQVEEDSASVEREREPFTTFRLWLKLKEYLHSLGLEVFLIIICRIIQE